MQGTATLEINKPVGRSALLSLFETVLNQNGATLVERDDVYRIMPAGGGAARHHRDTGGGRIGYTNRAAPLRIGQRPGDRA